MEIDRLRKELNELLDNLADHSERYSGNRPIPSLEISFVLSKVNKMQEKLVVLRHLLEEQENSSKHNKPKLILPKMDEDDEEGFGIEEEKISPEVAVGQDEKIEDEIEATIESEGTDVVAPNEQETKTPNIEQLPISKIIDAITLNDRYLYANELFQKDMNAFNELVKSIDDCSSFDEAKTLISNFEKEWDEENEHVVSFFSLVERRFM